MKIRNRRLMTYLITLSVCGFGVYLILDTFSSTLMFFVSPQELKAQPTKYKDRQIRLGGVVKPGSVERAADHTLQFLLTDFQEDVPVRYRGLVPSLFREGKGAVVKGTLDPSGLFLGVQILAKHDETYEPPKIQEILDKAPASKERALLPTKEAP